MTPRAIWIWFTASLAVLLLALGWVTRSTLRLEEERQAATRDAEVQEKVRLALWRMDAAASALLIREGARPPEHFRAFTAPSLAWSNTYQALGKDQILIPSPLLTEQTEHVLLHFEMTAEGRVTSPQVPVGNERDVAEAQFKTSSTRMAEAKVLLDKLRNIAAHEHSQGRSFACAPAPAASDPLVVRQEQSKDQQDANNPPVQQFDQVAQNMRSQVEYTKRSAALGNNIVQQAVPQMKEAAVPSKTISKTSTAPQAQAADVQPVEVKTKAAAPISVGPFRANWVENELLLVREVRENGSTRQQGVWLDWQKLRESLLFEINDLFPSASIVAAPVATSATDNPLQFASLPVRLIIGHVEALTMPLWTPFRRSLAIAWICVLLAAAAVATLLRGSVALSERRAAFVSAVTHELRTPLTTFRLYAELLANDMLPSAEKRAEYLATLQAEAERLSHLVENVLAYARLERGRATERAERLTLRELIERVRAPLERRAAQAGATLAIDHDSSADMRVQVDVSAVEQILFNLVDNACKYGAPDGTEKIIHLETGTSRGLALLRVRDHGQGIHRQETRRIFRPFHKSAQQAAHSAPGVGLGLALCKRLSHALGGDLKLDMAASSGGACFVLEMPAA